MKNVQKNVVKILLLILVFIITILISNKTYARSYSIENMDIQATILENGSINIKQKITYNFNGSYNGIYITIPYSITDKEQEEIQKIKKDNSIYNGNSISIKKISDYNGTNYIESESAYN